MHSPGVLVRPLEPAAWGDDAALRLVCDRHWRRTIAEEALHTPPLPLFWIIVHWAFVIGAPIVVITEHLSVVMLFPCRLFVRTEHIVLALPSVLHELVVPLPGLAHSRLSSCYSAQQRWPGSWPVDAEQNVPGG